MKRQVLLLLLSTLFNIYYSKTTKTITFGDINIIIECNPNHYFAFQMNITSSGFTSKQTVYLPLKEPEGAIAECIIPQDENEFAVKLYCKFNYLQFPITTKVKFTTNKPEFGDDIVVEGWENIQDYEFQAKCSEYFSSKLEPTDISKFTCKGDAKKLWEVELDQSEYNNIQTEVEHMKSSTNFTFDINFMINGKSEKNSCQGEYLETDSTVKKMKMSCELDGKVTKTKFHNTTIYLEKRDIYILVYPHDEYISNEDCTKKSEDSGFFGILSVYYLGILLIFFT